MTVTVIIGLPAISDCDIRPDAAVLLFTDAQLLQSYMYLGAQKLTNIVKTS